jgi:hypothetical protein
MKNNQLQKNDTKFKSSFKAREADSGVTAFLNKIRKKTLLSERIPRAGLCKKRNLSKTKSKAVN